MYDCWLYVWTCLRGQAVASCWQTRVCMDETNATLTTTARRRCCRRVYLATLYVEYVLLLHVYIFLFNSFCLPNYLNFHWTNFHAVFTVGFRYGCRWTIWTWLGKEQRDRATPSRAEGPVSRRRRPRGLLLQTRSSGVVGPSMQPIAIGAMVEQADGECIGFALLF